MIRDILLGIGLTLGIGVAGFGTFICLRFKADNSDADALAGAVRLFIGAPCLIGGIPLLGLCAWGLLR